MTLTAPPVILVHAAFVVFFTYFIFLMAYYLFLALVGLYEERTKRWEDETEDYSSVYFSTFTFPVSIIIPAHNEKEWIRDSVLSAVSLNYPEFEVIVVDDGSTDETLLILKEMLDLRPVDVRYIKHFKDGLVQQIYKSAKHPNVTVIKKAGGNKKAGASNAGLNIARYKYICVLDADTILERDSMLKVMAYVEKDTERVIGIGSYFGLSNGFDIKDGCILNRSLSWHPLIAYQNLEYIRSFFGNRIAWSKFNSMPIVAGGFGVWRRDVVYDLGGFSADFTCEDIEFTFRAHDYIVKKRGKGYRILMLPYYVSWTEGPSNTRSLISQRSRWQRVTDETIWSYRHILFNPLYKAFGFLTMPYFIIYEGLGVFFETASILFVAWCALAGIVDFKVFLLFSLFMLLSQTIISLLSMFSFIRSQRVFKPLYVLYMIVLGFLEFIWYRWLISIAKIAGTVDFLLGKKHFNQYERQKRS